jgi:hypothetical protein
VLLVAALWSLVEVPVVLVVLLGLLVLEAALWSLVPAVAAPLLVLAGGFCVEVAL